MRTSASPAVAYVPPRILLAYRRELWRMLSEMPGMSDWERVRLLYNAGFRWF